MTETQDTRIYQQCQPDVILIHLHILWQKRASLYTTVGQLIIKCQYVRHHFPRLTCFVKGKHVIETLIPLNKGQVSHALCSAYN